MKAKLFFLVLVFLIFLFPSAAWAKVVSVKNGDYNLSGNEIVDDDLFVAASNITIDGEVKGDLFAAGETVNINGKVDGSVYAGSGSIVLDKAIIGHDLVMGVGSASIKESKIGGGVISGSGSLIIDEKSEISDGLTSGSGSLSVNGKVGHSILAGSGSLNLNGEVGKNVEVSVGSLSLGPATKVSGDVIYVSSNSAEISSQAKVSGQVSQIMPHKDNETRPVKMGVFNLGVLAGGLYFGIKIWSLLGSILIGLVLVYLFKSLALELPNQIVQRPLYYSLIGLLTVALLPMTLFLLFLTIVGIPLAFFVILIFVVFSVVAKIFVAILFGSSLLDLLNKREANVYLKLILGLVAYTVLVSLPFVGWLIGIVVYLLGLGVLVSHVLLGKTGAVVA